MSLFYMFICNSNLLTPLMLVPVVSKYIVVDEVMCHPDPLHN